MKKNVIIFGANMSFSTHERNRANRIYILGRGEIQGITTIGPTALTDEEEKGTTIIVEGNTKQILQSRIKDLCYHCITMEIILIYFLMVSKN